MLKVRCADFIGSLHPERTILLADLLSTGSFVGFEWLDTELLKERLVSAWEFLERIAHQEGVRGINNLPLFFLQTSDPTADRVDKERRCKKFGEMYSDRYGHLPAEVFYTHVNPGFIWELADSPDNKGKIIGPLEWYTNHKELIGYQLPDYTCFLGVSKRVATEFIARIIIHDLGHYFLPKVPERGGEVYHNSMMIFAANSWRNFGCIENLDHWSNLVYQEATDPFFFLQAETALESVIVGESDHFKTWYKEKLRQWYTHSNRFKRQERLWGITPATPTTEARKHAEEKLRHIIRENFAAYNSK